jgi:hypothetical protein
LTAPIPEICGFREILALGGPLLLSFSSLIDILYEHKLLSKLTGFWLEKAI